MKWYVLFVRTGREERVKRFLENKLDHENITPFIPLHEIIFKRKDFYKIETKLLFPGYLFIESELSDFEFVRKLTPILYYQSDVIRLLRYSQSEIAMRDSEVQMLLDLYNGDYCIGMSKGIIVGDQIIVTDGPLKGRESIVRKIDRHKREAKIEMMFMGEPRLITVGLEIIKKYDLVTTDHSTVPAGSSGGTGLARLSYI